MGVMPDWMPKVAQGRMPQPLRRTLKSAYWGIRGLLPRKAPTGLEPSIYEVFGIGPIQTVFDVGANVGQTAEQLATTFPTAKIYCFEPVASTYATLSGRVRLLSNVRAFNLALGEKPARATITAAVNDQRNRVVSGETVTAAAGVDVQSVEVDSLDRFCDAHGIAGPDLLKSDTEGYDMQVLRGARGRLTSSVKAVIVEVGMLADDTVHTGFEEANTYLVGLGFRLRGIYGPHYKRNGTLHFANALFVAERRA